MRKRAAADAIEVNFLTDPLCPWSWAMAPLVASLREDAKVAFRSIMTGWLPSLAAKGVDAAKQEWREASATTGAGVDLSYWDRVAPATSLVAAAAVKAADFQGTAKGEAYLAEAREAAFARDEDVSSFDVLCRVADRTQLKADMFRTDLGVGRYTVDEVVNALGEVSPTSEAVWLFGRRKMLRCWQDLGEDLRNAERQGLGSPAFHILHGKRDAVLRGFCTKAQVDGVLQDLA